MADDLTSKRQVVNLSDKKQENLYISINYVTFLLVIPWLLKMPPA